MKNYIRENLKLILSVAVLIVCTVTLISANILLEGSFPTTSELHIAHYGIDIVHYNAEEDVFAYEYTGKKLTPTVNRLVLSDSDGNAVFKYGDEISNIEYDCNTEIGYADIELSVSGYKGTILLQNAFRIQPAQVQELQITATTGDTMELAWKEVLGADGYLVYKSDNGEDYTPVKDIKAEEPLIYQEADMPLNATLTYCVSAYTMLDEEMIQGINSDVVTQYTPLATPVLSSVNYAAYNALQLNWPIVDGAVGYQVFRSLTRDGEYTCIAEINDGHATSYTDTTCECGIEYFYYIKAHQSAGGQDSYGDPSNIGSGSTKPNKVNITGTTINDNTQVSLQWKKAGGAQGYEIYRSSDYSADFALVAVIESADTLFWSETGLSETAAYRYKICPYTVVNGTKITGSFSNVYTKEITYVFNGELASSVSVLTQYAGARYVFGGATLGGWDCSGFTQWTYLRHFGISLPRTAAAQASVGRPVNMNDRASWQPGDLIFYTEGRGISHVAVYLGNNMLIHALSPKYNTLIQDVDYYERWDTATSMSCVRRYF